MVLGSNRNKDVYDVEKMSFMLVFIPSYHSPAHSLVWLTAGE